MVIRDISDWGYPELPKLQEAATGGHLGTQTFSAGTCVSKIGAGDTDVLVQKQSACKQSQNGWGRGERGFTPAEELLAT